MVAPIKQVCSETFVSYKRLVVEQRLGIIHIIDKTGQDGVKNCKTLHIKLVEERNEWWWDNYDIETCHQESNETERVLTAAQAAFGGRS